MHKIVVLHQGLSVFANNGNNLNTENIGIQRGSEIRTCPDFEWSKRDWIANGQNFKWDLKSGHNFFEISYLSIWIDSKPIVWDFSWYTKEMRTM